MPRLSRHLWNRFGAIALPYWFSEERWAARGLLALLVVLLLGQVASEVLFNLQTGEFTSALAAKDGPRFWRTIYECLAILVVAVPIYALFFYVRDKLGLYWRRWLTNRFLNSYFNDRAFYELTSSDRIDNPDQRIAEDVNTFTTKSLYFLSTIAWSIIQVVAFAGVLWAISKPLVYFLILYAVVGTVVTTFLFGRVMIGINFLQLRREADFRFSLVRVRENAESIALYRGEDQERSQVEQRFGAAFTNATKLINWQLMLNVFAYAYKFLTIVIPSAMIATRVISGELEVGRAVQAAGAFTAILTALAIVVDNFDNLTKFIAGIDRLDTFVKFLEVESPQGKAARKLEVVTGSELALDRVSLRTLDDKRWIVQNLSFVIKPGEGLMIMGPSGSGKSSLLRAISGLASCGSGTLVRPPLDAMMFLPQSPYMVLGSLRTQLLYPNIKSTHSDEELLHALEMVNLPLLTDQFGGLDAEADWENVLSVGEQQRLAFARVLLTKPLFAMLDEATSALDFKNEERLYRLLSNTSTTFVSVSHHSTLLKYHHQVLELGGDGTWKLRPARRYRSAG